MIIEILSIALAVTSIYCIYAQVCIRANKILIEACERENKNNLYLIDRLNAELQEVYTELGEKTIKDLIQELKNLRNQIDNLQARNEELKTIYKEKENIYIQMLDARYIETDKQPVNPSSEDRESTLIKDGVKFNRDALSNLKSSDRNLYLKDLVNETKNKSKNSSVTNTNNQVDINNLSAGFYTTTAGIVSNSPNLSSSCSSSSSSSSSCD